MPLDNSTNYVETKADPTLDDLIAWLETRDPKEEYRYFNMVGGCLIGKFAAAIGRDDWMHIHNQVASHQGWLYHVAAHDNQTMGGALRRARKWRASHAV